MSFSYVRTVFLHVKIYRFSSSDPQYSTCIRRRPLPAADRPKPIAKVELECLSKDADILMSTSMTGN